MKRIIARLYILVITVLILFSLIYLLNEIRISRNEFINESVKVSEEAKKLIEENWFKNDGFENQKINNALKDFMNKDINIHSIIIYSKDHGLVKFSSRFNDRDFLLNSIIPNDPTWNMRPEYSFDWWEKYNNNIISTPLQINDRGYAFDIIYNVLSTKKVEDVFKNAFLIVIIFLVLTIVVIILFTIWKNKYSINEYNDDFEPLGQNQPIASQGGVSEGLDSEENFDELNDLDSFDDMDSDDGLDSLDDFDMDSDDSLDSLDGFDMDSDDDSFGDLDSMDDAESLDDFDISSNDDSLDEMDSLDDFDLDTGDSSDINNELEDLDDFSIDLDEPADDLEDFSMDFDEPDKDIDDSFTNDTNSEEELEELDDFSLDIDESSEDIDDISLDIDEPLEESEDNLDELDDFSLDIDEPAEEIEDNLDELDDFSLDIDDPAEEIEDNLDELDDFSLDIDETSEETEDNLDELDDFSLDMDDDLDDISEELDISESLDDLVDNKDTPEETEDLTASSSYDLDDFALDSDNNDDGYDLDDFSLDSKDVELDSEEEINEDNYGIDDTEIDLLDDIDDMDLSPEAIEASTDMNDLPEMDIEEELISNEAAKQSSELGPAISSMLERASVTDSDLAIATLSISGNNNSESFDFIKDNISDSAEIYSDDSGRIVLAFKDFTGARATAVVNKLIQEAKAEEIEITAGLSSMAGRRVGENRLLAESIKALDKADESSKELLAFKPDPKKYTDYIKNNA